MTEDRDVAVDGHVQRDVGDLRERARGGGARPLVLTPFARHDRAVGKQVALSIDDRRTVEHREADERVLIERLGVDQMMQARLDLHRVPIDVVA